MSLISGKYWTGDPKIKPEAWGPFEDVKAAIQDNAINIYGIDPTTLALCLPFWTPGRQIDYVSPHNDYLTVTGSIVAYEKNCILFTGVYNQSLSIDSSVLNNIDSKITIFSEFEPFLNTNNMYLFDKSLCYSLTLFYGGDIRPTVYLNGSPCSVRADDCLLQKQTVTISYDNSNLKVFQDGRFTATSAVNGDIDSASSKLFIGGYGPNGNSSRYNGRVYCFYVFNTALTANQIQLLNDNPYGLFQPITRRSYFIPSGEIGITLNSNNLTINSFMDSYQLNLIKLLDLSDVLVASDVTDSIISGLVNIIQGNDVNIDSLINTVSIQAIRKLIGQEINSITQITNVVLSVAKQYNLTDLESLSEVTNVVFSVIRKLSIDNINISSEIINVSIDIVKSLLVNEVSSLTDITNAVISLTGNTTFNDPQSQTEITSIVMSVLRQLKINDLSSNTEVTDVYLNAIRQINFNDISSISQIEAVIVRTTEAMGIDDLSATTSITDAILSVFKGLTPINVNIESNIISPAVSVLRNIFSNTINISSSIDSVRMQIVGLIVTGKVSVTFSMAVPGGTFTLR